MTGLESGQEPPIPSLESRTGGRRKPRLQQPRKMLPWLICSGLVTAIWSFWANLGMDSLEGASSSAEKFGALFGGVLGAGLFVGGLVALVVHLAAGRRLTPGKGLRNFAIFAFVAMLATAPVTVLRIFAISDGAVIMRQEAEIMADYRVRTDAAFDRIGLYERSATAQARLLPEAIATPGGLERARQANEELRVLQEASETEVNTLMRDLEVRLEAIARTDHQREVLRQNIAQSRAISDRSLAIARRVVSVQDEQLDVLARRPRGWAVEGGVFAFSRQRDLDDFNRLAMETEALRTEMTEIQAGSGGAPAAQP